MISDDPVYADLDQAERQLMVLVLNEYAGSAQVAVELLPPLVGRSSYDEWGDYVFPLMESIDAGQPLSQLDWARALLLTEFGFGSDMVANARRFGPARDEYWVLVLRSLQDKLSTEQRVELLRENAALPARGATSSSHTTDVTNEIEDIRLDDSEHRLMTVALGAYSQSPRRGFDLLSPLCGQAEFDDWAAYVATLYQAVEAGKPMGELDWARALFLTEMGFISSLVGFATQFRGDDERGITLLRSLQVTIITGTRYLLFSENATFPWIARPRKKY